MKNYFWLILFLVIGVPLANADVVTLKTGQVIEGKITNKTPVYVRIETQGGRAILEFLMENVESIEATQSVLEEIEKVSAASEVLVEEKPSAEVKDMFEEEFDEPFDKAEEGIFEAPEIEEEITDLLPQEPEEIVVIENAAPVIPSVVEGYFADVDLKEKVSEEEEAGAEVEDSSEDQAENVEDENLEDPVVQEQPFGSLTILEDDSHQEENVYYSYIKKSLAYFSENSFWGSYSMALLGLFLLSIYIFLNLPLYLMARKFEVGPPFLSWIPIINLYVFVKCADRPGWWFLLLFIPMINVLIGTMIFCGICERLGRPAWLGLLSLIPVINFFFIWYLAFCQKPVQIEEEIILAGARTDKEVDETINESTNKPIDKTSDYPRYKG